ncbi:hypothetical protein PanWU01x14_105660 [Parasponia andersonii]|uniref:Uncharacterized protein n=1 Tax=Parasponia andersonii TaxID=3476 RepID=A0A2P5D100_PARAD|nr:hypothetical protein PanWU01x14_105660 [Parasponia andersonii]
MSVEKNAETGAITAGAVTSTCPPYKLLISCPSGLSPTQVLSALIDSNSYTYLGFVCRFWWVQKVSVVFDEACDRVPHPDANLENSISEASLL